MRTPDALGTSHRVADVSPHDALRALADAVSEAGELARKMFRTGVRSWNKQNSSPVTEADMAVDALLRRRLTAFAPHYGWLSEESADGKERLALSRVWVVDPIDGTRSFVKGESDWVVAAALVEDGRPIAAAVHAPLSDELFAAALGEGATRNGAPIRARATASLADARITGPRSIVERLTHSGFPITVSPRIFSLALRLTRVATGEVDGALAGAHAYDWDIAAANLIVEEAGGVLSSFEGVKPVYNRPQPIHGALVAAGADLHSSLVAAVNAAATREDGSGHQTAGGSSKP